MAKRKLKSMSGYSSLVCDREAVSDEAAGNGGSWLHLQEPDETLYSYLKLAGECMESVEKMSPRNFNNEQCDYLVEKLKVVTQSASLFLEVSRAELYGRSASLHVDKYIGMFKLLLGLANQIENFVQGCCKDAWIQAAMTLTNVAEHVSSIGFNLELCRVAFCKDCAATGSLPLDHVDDIEKSEVKSVEKKASADLETLLVRVTLELNSLSGENRDLASYLLQRLLRIQAKPSASSLSCINDEESIWGRLFEWVKPSERLGRGATATVHKATWLGTEVAKKTFQGRENPDFMKEVGILGKLCHPNITSMFCCAKNQRRCAIIMELMDEDLHDMMQRRCDGNNGAPPFPILEAVDIMLQIGQGVNYLHTQKIVHRDLKSFNILVKSVMARGSNIECVHAKVADFGLSKTKESSIRYSNQTVNTGTNRWMAPEVIKLNVGFGGQGKTLEPKYPFKCDVYSFAMVCYEILTGDEPFCEEISLTMIKQNVLKGERPKLPEYCPPLLKALIQQCWIPTPKDRPSFDMICSELRYLKYLLLTGVNTIPSTSRLAQPVSTGTIDSTIADAATPPQQPPPILKYTKLWEGILAGQRQQKPVPICKIEAYRQTKSSEKLAVDWPPAMLIVRLVGQDMMNNKEYEGKAELLVFRPLSHHGFLVQLAEKKLCAVIELPSQTLLLSTTDKPGRMNGILVPREMDVLIQRSQPTQTQQATGAVAQMSSPVPSLEVLTGQLQVPNKRVQRSSS